jgi:DNA primase
MGEIHDLKELVREANPVAEVVGETIALHRHGSRLVGAHHTHNSDSGTSFHVDPDQGLYYCFNCHEGGDVFSWIMRLHQCSFSEALQLLARRARLPLPEWTAEERARHQRLWAEREVLQAMYLAAAQFYHAQLTPDLQAWCG